MLNSGKKIRVLRDKKNKYSNSCVVRKKNSERNKPPPPLQVKWSVPYYMQENKQLNQKVSCHCHAPHGTLSISSVSMNFASVVLVVYDRHNQCIDMVYSHLPNSPGQSRTRLLPSH